MDEIGKYIKKLASDQIESGKPAAVIVGTVISTSPMKIQIDSKLTLTESFLILTKAVVDYETEVTVDWQTENRGGGSGENSFSLHNHSIQGRKKIIVHNGVKNGDKVTLLRVQGGQKFVVMDIVGGGKI